MTARLENYLTTYRKRVGLTQRDVAFLLGWEGEAMISRFERRVRRPSLKAALAFQIVLRAPANELFAGLYQKVEHTTLQRARVLAERIEARKPDQFSLRRLAALHGLCPRGSRELS